MGALRGGGSALRALSRGRRQRAGGEMERFALRVGGLVPRLDIERRGSWFWAPFGLRPLVVGERAAYGVLSPEGLRPREDSPVILWDMSRGQVAPVASSLDHFCELASHVPGFGPGASKADHEAVIALDEGAAASLVSVGESYLDEGELDSASHFFEKAATAASWWMAPAVLLHRLARQQGRETEAARWASVAIARRLDGTGAGRFGLVPRLGPEPRAVLRNLVTWLRRHEGLVAGLPFDPAWRTLRDAPDVFDSTSQAKAALALERTGRTEQAALRWEWLLRAQGSPAAARETERLFGELGWLGAQRDVAELLRFVPL